MFENRIIHRDLKLGNLRLDKNGLLKMIDFGSVAPVEGERPSWYPENTCCNLYSLFSLWNQIILSQL
jgi:serine/threonine protein kinase